MTREGFWRDLGGPGIKKDGMIELENYGFVAARLPAVQPLG